jgi:signal transduction histidine kinase
MRFGAAAAIVLAPFVAPLLGVDLPLLPLLGVACLLVGLNATYWLDLRRLSRVRKPDVVQQVRRSAGVQVVLDLVVLAAVVHLTGGIENPLLFYYVFHVVIAGILFPNQIAYLYASLGIGLVLAMELSELFGILPHWSVTAFSPNGQYRNPAYAAGTLFVFASTVYLAAYLSSSVSGELRKRQREVLSLNTALEQEAHSLQKANRRLIELDRQRAVFLSIATHDLRAPLAAVLAYLDAVLGGFVGPLGDRQAGMLRRAEARLRGLLDLTDDLLDVSRIEHGELVPDRQAVALAEIAEATLEDMRPAAEAGRVALVAEIAPDLPRVWGSPVRLRQALTNLTHNAVKFTPPGGSVLLRARAIADGRLRVEVSDTGPGVRSEDLPRLFQEFFRGAGAKGSGAGLGLYIARSIVEAHGGRIWAESPCPDTGLGTRLVVELPALGQAAGAGK